MLPAVAFTIAFGETYIRDALQLRATFKAHHPDIPFYIIDNDSYAVLAQQNYMTHVGEVMAMRTIFGWFFSRHFQRVIYLDSDIAVLGTLDDLLVPSPAAILTHDVSNFHYGLPELPGINNGVVSGGSESFWLQWATLIYSHLIPDHHQFVIDQITLRIMSDRNLCNHVLLDEKGLGTYYNLSYREHPGEWHVLDGKVRKGDATVKIYHFAGIGPQSPKQFPDPVDAFVQSHRNDGPCPQDDAIWESFKGDMDWTFGLEVANFFSAMPFWHISTLEPRLKIPMTDIHRTEAPMALDRFRKCKLPPGWTRKVKRPPPRILYYPEVENHPRIF